jgi:hypothetical protein
VHRVLENSLRLNRYRFVPEFLLSLNLALIVEWADAQASLSGATALSITSWINRSLHLHPHSNIGGYTSFYIIALAGGLAIFGVLRLLSLVPLIEKVILSVAGLVSLLALPCAWLSFRYCFPGFFRGQAALPDPPHLWLFIELLASAAGALLFLRGKRPGWIAGGGLLTAHFALWGWLFLGGPYFWLAPGRLIIPVVGFFSCIAWTSYLTKG